MTAGGLFGQGWRFARGYRALARHPVTLAEGTAVVSEQLAQRGTRFLANLDALVWPHRDSPTRRLLECAGLEPADVKRLVDERGLDDALVTLRDAGVFVTYEESAGREPARRGSQVFEFVPEDFVNPRVRPDFIVTTGGSRSRGQRSGSSFAYVRAAGPNQAVRTASWGVYGKPTAIWMPLFPGAGLATVLRFTVGGNRPERWFSQVPVSMPGVPAHKQLANRLLDVAGIVTGGGLPRPRYAPTHDLGDVLDWCQDAVRRGPALLVTFASSGARLGAVAADAGVSLEGLVVSLGGEPVTPAKMAAVAASGARPVSVYAFTPEGAIGVSCEHSSVDDVHLMEHSVALATRDRDTAVGRVPALCFTTLAPTAPRVLVNVENDDYADVTRDDAPCECLFGRLGMRTRLRNIRGVSKIVTGGATLPGAVFERLVDDVLPARFGGSPSDYQFVEDDGAGPTRLSLRVAPSVGPIDEAAVAAAVEQELQSSDAGRLTAAVLDAAITVARKHPAPTAGGKVLPFERLAVPEEERSPT